ncbi:retrovirus-related Pol polyprotein from transposon 17.6 [Trichonephila clavipes]|nr:retrovirus-related Pol polyprotein from transposon 17.6 [Trichonephila clavipes]
MDEEDDIRAGTPLSTIYNLPYYEYLNDYPKISQSLKSSSTNNIKILHRLIFGENGDRKNRSRLREFSGFPTDFNVEETKTKIIKEFILKELIAVCNLLHLEFTTELESCCDIILTHLCDLTLFKSTVLNSGSESDLELNEKSPPENRHSQPITSDSASNDLRSENMKSLDLNDSAQNLLPLFDKQNTCNSFLSFNLRDLLELVKPFTSRDSYSIETFISDIEDIFRLYQITNPIHQIIFVKKCLKGPAENLIRSIRGITNWSQMKEHLLNEFSDRINSAQLHNMMQARRLKPTETLQEYFLTMRDLAHKALCDTGSQATIINEKTYQKLGYPTLNPSQCTFSGIGRDRVESKDAILGIDFLQQTKFTFGRDGIRIFRDVDECKNDDVLVNLANLFDEQQCKLDLPHISNSKIRNDVEQLVNSYKPKKNYDTDLKMTILLSDDIPVSQRSRRLPFVEQKIVENQIQEWLNTNIIKPSCSDYAAPIVLCKKKNGEHRLCVDYRNLNRKMIKDKFPLPLIEEVLDKLENSKVYTSLDLKNGFFHVPMDPNSTKYTSFVTHEGQYEFLRVPFGLSNSPSVFQRFIYTVFRKLIRDNILIVYMDDLLIPSQNEAEGLNKLRLVLQTAADFGLELNLKKCNFLQRKIEFLGYIIENGTIKPSPSTTQAVQNFPQPQTPRQLQSFIGLTSYFRKFIPNYARIARPFSDLLRDNVKFKFGPTEIASFQELKNILSENPVLHVFQQGYPLELHTDASSLGFGAVLLQKSDDGLFHPIPYFSRKTTVQQEKYSSYELEVLAIIEALKKFRSYLLGTKFKIITDCDAFQITMHKKICLLKLLVGR